MTQIYSVVYLNILLEITNHEGMDCRTMDQEWSLAGHLLPNIRTKNITFYSLSLI